MNLQNGGTEGEGVLITKFESCLNLNPVSVTYKLRAFNQPF